MFKENNVIAISAGILILLNCAVEFFSFATFNTLLSMAFDFNFYRAVVILLLMAISIFGAISILFKSKFALKICLLIYIVQIFGFIYNEVYYILSYGMWLSWSTQIVNLSVEVNLVATFISVIILLALKSKKGRVSDLQ